MPEVKVWDTGKSNGVSLERVARHHGWPGIPDIGYYDVKNGVLYVESSFDANKITLEMLARVASRVL